MNPRTKRYLLFAAGLGQAVASWMLQFQGWDQLAEMNSVAAGILAISAFLTGYFTARPADQR